jgi:hypothetical protein
MLLILQIQLLKWQLLHVTHNTQLTLIMTLVLHTFTKLEKLWSVLISHWIDQLCSEIISDIYLLKSNEQSKSNVELFVKSACDKNLKCILL